MTQIGPVQPPVAANRAGDPVWAAAQKLEAAFLNEMLKSAGLGTPRAAFGGGAGEEQFASFLRQAQADEMARAGGIGLAESLYQSMTKGADADGQIAGRL